MRTLGDCDGNTGVEPLDVHALIMALNGVPPPGYHDNAFDLDANGAAEPMDLMWLIFILDARPVP